tara:strand:+ start:246 stop:689 length:444 start_codon:yes stop_codon:yes gene_type:complete
MADDVQGDAPVAIGDVPPTSESGVTVDDRDDVFLALYDGISELRGDAKRKSSASISMEELRNRAVFELTGETVSQVSYDNDDTLPWVKPANTEAEEGSVDSYGGKSHDTFLIAQALLDSIDFILENEDKFDDTELTSVGLIASSDDT